MNKPIVISLGGSLICPDTLDTEFLRAFKKLIENHLRKGKRFIIVTGGGRTARNYQEAASKLTKLKHDDLDWLGIHATRLNAHLIRTILKEHAEPKIVLDPVKRITYRKRILVAAGWKPGFSTDYIATKLAIKFKAGKIINLSNIDYVYNKDPRKYKEAERIERICWKDFRKIVGNKWDPGLNAPFDPVASKLAEQAGLQALIASGKDMENIGNLLSERQFKGTVIGDATRFIIVRHGQTLENLNHILQGQLHGTLSPLGAEQARKVAQRLQHEKIDVIYSSDLQRAYNTAQEISKFHKVKVTGEIALREAYFGPLQGKKHTEIDWNNLPPEVESREHVRRRTKLFVRRILHKHKGKNILIVGHGGSNGGVLAAFFGKNYADGTKIKNTAVYIVDVDRNGKANAVIENCTKHLE